MNALFMSLHLNDIGACQFTVMTAVDFFCHAVRYLFIYLFIHVVAPVIGILWNSLQRHNFKTNKIIEPCSRLSTLHG